MRGNFRTIVQQEDFVQGLLKGLQGGVAVFLFELTLPNDDCVPAEVAQLNTFFNVALFVALYLLFPELGVAFGRDKVAATFVSVPEAAVDEDDGAVFAQDNVGGAWQALDVYAVAVAMGVQVTAHNHLGLGVLALDARHALVPLLCGHSVCHATKILFSNGFCAWLLVEKPRGTECLDMSCVCCNFAIPVWGDSMENVNFVL